MIYLLVGIFFMLTAISFLIWLRKVQYDGIHRNFFKPGGSLWRQDHSLRVRQSTEIYRYISKFPDYGFVLNREKKVIAIPANFMSLFSSNHPGK